MMKNQALYPLSIALALALTGCATKPASTPGDALARAQAAKLAGLDEPAEVAAYNQAVADTVAWWQDQEGAQGKQPLAVPGTQLSLSAQLPPNVFWDEFLPADSLKPRVVKGQRYTRAGVGSPQVAVWASNHDRRTAQPLLSEAGYSDGLTATLDFPKDGQAVLVFLDPDRVDSVKIGQRGEPLAADFTAPIEAEMRKREGAAMFSRFGALLNSGKYLDRLGLIATEPPRPEATPVVFVHGLMSKPDAWLEMVNGLSADPEIRKNYQFYFFRYPTGVPVAYSSAKFQDQLAILQAELLKAHNRNGGRLVLVGHSMGGLLSKRQVQTSGDQVWTAVFGATPETLKMKPKSVAALKPYMEFTANPNVERVIFICTPHKGSKIADFSIVRGLATWLIKLPVHALDATVGSLFDDEEADPALDKLSAKQLPSSVANLSPESPFLKVSQTLPFAPGVHLHTIAGNAKGRPLDDPRAGDGVVPYASAHLDNAESELVIRSDHSGQAKPEAIAEVRRILLLQLKGR